MAASVIVTERRQCVCGHVLTATASH